MRIGHQAIENRRLPLSGAGHRLFFSASIALTILA
jgi:hypothetical protein